VLLAEDVASSREVLVAQLTTLGADVVAVENGVEAVAAAAASPFDLVLLDMQMPELDGPGAARQIRGLGLQLRPWIAALTASPTEENLVRCLEAGMDAFYAKPAGLATLRHILESRPERTCQEPVDWALLCQLRGAGRTEVAAVAAEFTSGTRPLAPQLRELVRDPRPAALAEAARALRHHGAGLGAQRLGELCEQLASAPPPASAELIVGDIETELERIAGALRRAEFGDLPT